MQQAEARAADLEKFIDKERHLYGEKIRALEAQVLQHKSEMHESRRSHDQQVRHCSAAVNCKFSAHACQLTLGL